MKAEENKKYEENQEKINLLKIEQNLKEQNQDEIRLTFFEIEEIIHSRKKIMNSGIRTV